MKIKLFFKNLKQKVSSAVDFKDVLMLAGLVMAGKGIYMVYPPAMWFTVGVFIIFLGWPSSKAVK